MISSGYAGWSYSHRNVLQLATSYIKWPLFCPQSCPNVYRVADRSVIASFNFLLVLGRSSSSSICAVNSSINYLRVSYNLCCGIKTFVKISRKCFRKVLAWKFETFWRKFRLKFLSNNFTRDVRNFDEILRKHYMGFLFT